MASCSTPLLSDIAIVDADALVFQASHAVERPINFGDGWSDDECRWVLSASPNEAWRDFQRRLTFLQERVKADQWLFALSDTTNFRFEVMHDYKAQRKLKRKPMCISDVRQMLRDNCETITLPRCEADDAIGVAMTRVLDQGGTPVAISDDKDMLQIPGRHMTFDGVVRHVKDRRAGDNWHMVQTIAGDQADGYPGAKGMGQKRAELWVEAPYRFDYCEVAKEFRKSSVFNPADLWDAAVSLFVKGGGTEDDALRNARVARILRDEDWDEECGSPILWSPY